MTKVPNSNKNKTLRKISYCFREILGIICVFLIKKFKASPERYYVILKFGLPIYRNITLGRSTPLQKLLSTYPHKKLKIETYYRVRLANYANMLLQHQTPLSNEKIRLQGYSTYKDALKKNQTIVLLGLHMGCYELLYKAPCPPEQKKPFLIGGAKVFSKNLESYLYQNRCKKPKEFIFIEHQAIALKLWLKKKGVLCVMIDQNAEQSMQALLWKRLTVPFPARLYQFLSHFEVICIPTYTYFENKVHSIFYEQSFSSKEKNLSQWKEWHQDFLERAVSLAPYQWNWSYPGNKRL